MYMSDKDYHGIRYIEEPRCINFEIRAKIRRRKKLILLKNDRRYDIILCSEELKEEPKRESFIHVTKII